MKRDLLMLTAWLLMLVQPGAPTKSQADEIDQFDRFLERMGLVDLQVRHLEQSLSAISGERRLEVSRRLADLYADQLIRHADEADQYADIQQRVRRLLMSTPEANTPSVQVMLLQADYNRAESLVSGWLEDPPRAELRSEARQILVRISRPLDQMRRQMTLDVDRQLRELETFEPGDARSAAERELNRQRAVLARAIYFCGWSNYYTAITAGPNPGAAAPTATDPLGLAELSFRQLLEIEDTPSDEVTADWLGLESLARARAAVGLALTFAARGQGDSSNACFTWLRSPGVHPLVAEQVDYWQLRGWLNAGRWNEAVAVSRERLAAMSGEPTQGKVSFCVALVRGGFAVPAANRLDEHAELVRAGMLGLARFGQNGIIEQLLDQYAIQIPDDSGWVMLSIRGAREFAAAEKSRSPDDYRRAKQTLVAAMAGGESREVRVTGRCQYTLAWTHYRLGEHQSAAEQFRQAASRLRAGGDSLAVEALWMAFVACRHLARDNDRFLATATEITTALERDFPGHPHTDQAAYYLAQLVERSSPAELMAKLSRVPTDDPQFREAGYDLCVLLHRACREAQGADRVARRLELQSAVERYATAGAADRRAKVLLLEIDLILGASDADLSRAQQQLDRVANLVREDLTPIAVEYHFWRLELANAAGDSAAGQTHAQWLVDHGRGSAFESAGLVALLRAAESSPDIVTPTAARQRYAWYARLVELLGEAPEQLREIPNAQVANSKLAHYAYLLGQHHEAAERLGKLLIAFPNHQDYLRRAGLATFQARSFDQSITYWRTILSGTKSGTGDWYEAKYYQLACLVETDRQRARQVFRQLKLLHPEMGPPPWRERLEQLERRIS